jgi:hypothetical protein
MQVHPRGSRINKVGRLEQGENDDRINTVETSNGQIHEEQSTQRNVTQKQTDVQMHSLKNA